jgi:3',5'-nucleoside bisphosphate phosphatase
VKQGATGGTTALRADLHIHTTASDGTWDPAELVRHVAAAGIQLFAVTDHDCTDSVAEAERQARASRLRFLPGVELNATKDGHNFHILGYGIDWHNGALQDLCRHNRALLEKKDEDSIRRLEERDWPVSVRDFARYDYDRHRGGWRALAYLEDLGLCTDVGDFFRRIFTAENDLGFPAFPPVTDVIRVIHEAGGAALCAHLASTFHGEGVEAYLPELQEEPLDGLECYHSGHSEKDTQFLASYCREHGLCISGGSDCHGTFVPSRHLGQPVVDSVDLYLPGLL